MLSVQSIENKSTGILEYSNVTPRGLKGTSSTDNQAPPQQKKHILGATNPKLINVLQGHMLKPRGAYLGSGAKQG